MTSAPEKRYCWTCKRSIAPAWWQRHMASLGHVRRALGDPPPFVHPKTRQGDGPLSDDDDENDDDEADVGAALKSPNNPDLRVQCGGCSRRIEPGFEYHRDDGKDYHNNCVPLATTRPQAAQGAPRRAGKLLAGVRRPVGRGKATECLAGAMQRKRERRVTQDEIQEGGTTA